MKPGLMESEKVTETTNLQHKVLKALERLKSK